MFVGERATGATGLLQCAWVYNRAYADFTRICSRAGCLAASERSPLPFGRHRWVSAVRSWALTPLVPVIPKRLAKYLVGIAAGSPTTVIAFNLGVVNPAFGRPDGAAADYFAMMSLFAGVTTAMMHLSRGRLALMSGQVNEQVFVSVLAYQPGRCNTNGVVQHDLSCVLPGFSLTAVIVAG